MDVEKSPISTKAADDDRFTGDDSDFGGTEARKRLERKLLWKLDLRMSILVVIYVLNYVRVLQQARLPLADRRRHRVDRPQQRWVRPSTSSIDGIDNLKFGVVT